MLKSKRFWKWGKFLLAFLILFLIFQLFKPDFYSGKLTEWATRLGVFGPLIIIGYITFSHILAPLVGTPGVVVSAVLFGVYRTVFYLYIAGLISAAINFWISRKFGRKFVSKLAGKKNITEIDTFVDIFGVKLLIISRLFGFAFFEVISYAAGLTKISFKKYFLITLIFSAVPAFVFAFLFQDFNFLSLSAILIWVGAIIITGAIFTLFLKSFIIKRKTKLWQQSKKGRSR